jgi:predicted AlkP superfamily pyrophosphatase or phosphodiesterase
MFSLRTAVCCLLLCLQALWPARAQQLPATHPPVLLISIDSLRPDYVLEAARHGVRVPNLQRFVKEGSYATAVKGVVPTVTYPSHTTILTGVSPAKHGIYGNHTFDPLDKNYDGWYWYAEDIKVPTLWDAAGKAGLVTVNSDWPVSVAAKVGFNIPQVWRAGTADDRKLLRALATPLLPQLERELGPYAEGLSESIEGDEQRARFAVRLIELEKPQFMTAYFTGLDHEQHGSGPFSATAFKTLERLDVVVGQLRAAAERVSGGPPVIAIVSDHGMARTDKAVNLFTAFRSAGLMEFDEKGKPKSWQAAPWPNGGSAAIMLREPGNAAVLSKVKALLDPLAADPANGIARVLDASETRAMGGFPDAAFVVDLKPGYRMGSASQGPLVAAGPVGGTHGYLPSLAEMNASFFIVGPGIPAGRSLGEIDMRSIAPTLARLLGVNLPGAEGKDLLGR